MSNNTIIGLGLFVADTLRLLSMGIQESIDTIETEMEANNVVEFLMSKYDFKFFGSQHDIKVINDFYMKRVSFIKGQERSKYGLDDKTNGLYIIPVLFSFDYETQYIE